MLTPQHPRGAPELVVEIAPTNTVAVWIGADVDPPASFQLTRVEQRSGDEQVNLDTGRVVDEIRARPRRDRPAEGLDICVELVSESLDEGDNLRRGHVDDDVDINGGARLAAEGAGERAANTVTDAGSVQCLEHERGDVEQVDHGSR